MTDATIIIDDLSHISPMAVTGNSWALVSDRVMGGVSAAGPGPYSGVRDSESPEPSHAKSVEPSRAKPREPERVKLPRPSLVAFADVATSFACVGKKTNT